MSLIDLLLHFFFASDQRNMPSNKTVFFICMYHLTYTLTILNKQNFAHETYRVCVPDLQIIHCTVLGRWKSWHLSFDILGPQAQLQNHCTTNKQNNHSHCNTWTNSQFLQLVSIVQSIIHFISIFFTTVHSQYWWLSKKQKIKNQNLLSI
jgi:hypothetical protein